MKNNELTLKYESCVLIIIDVQEKLMPMIQHKEKILDNIILLINFARIINIPIIITEQSKLGPTLTSITNELKHPTIIEKITFDCFGCEKFRDKLNDFNRNILILCGIESHICIMQTALNGIKLLYSIQFVSDASGSRDLYNWKVACNRLQTNKITITSTEMLIYELLREANTDEFRMILPLIKKNKKDYK